MGVVTDLMRRAAVEAASRHDCLLWDIELVREAGTQILRLYLDRAEGVGIEVCEAVSRTFEKWLDEEDPIPESYVLEVSSAGLTRALKRPEDYHHFLGSRVDVHLYKPAHGLKEYVGLLEGYDGVCLTLGVEGERLEFAVKDVSLVRLNPLL